VKAQKTQGFGFAPFLRCLSAALAAAFGMQAQQFPKVRLILRMHFGIIISGRTKFCCKARMALKRAAKSLQRLLRNFGILENADAMAFALEGA
jgi:hypothetical protein